MRLELLVEQETPEVVSEHLASGIRQLIPVITGVDVERYELSKQNVYTLQEVGDIAEREIGRMREDANWRGSEGPMILLSEVDAMQMPPLPSIGLGPQIYYYLPQLLVSSEEGRGLVLIGTHDLWFSYHARGYDSTRKSRMWPEILAGNGCNDGTWGVWSRELKGGIVSIAKTPVSRNILRAAHELGHGLGLEHHNGCIMQAGATYTQKNQLDFCEPCKDVVNGVVVK